jgi:hypothetical protein
MKNSQSFFMAAQPGDIVSVRTEGWIGRIIRWVTSSNINHVGMYLGNGLMIESTLGYGVRIVPAEIYLNDPRCEVFLSRVPKRFDSREVIAFAYNFYGTRYDLWGQIGIFIKYMTKKVGWNRIITFWGKNKADDSGLWCSEFIGVIFTTVPYKFTDEDTSYLTPSEVFDNSTPIPW